MVPRVFVSSTILDLHHVRDALRELIDELGYQPVMSDYGEIGYLPRSTAADSCYKAAKECDVGIIIIGKRYGDGDESVTHNEYRALKKCAVITLLERDLLVYQRIWSANRDAPTTTFPGMDHPEKTFGFMAEIQGSSTNNGVGEFHHIEEARTYVRLQLAHIFGDFLRGAYDPIKGEVKDVLAEIRALRNDINKGKQNEGAVLFLNVSRALLEDSRHYFRVCLTYIFGNPEQPVTAIIQSDNFSKMLESAGWKIFVFDDRESLEKSIEQSKGNIGNRYAQMWTRSQSREKLLFEAGYTAFRDRRELCLTKSALHEFEQSFQQCKSSAGSPT